MKSWKIGAVSGLIAGVIAGIVFSIFIKIAVYLGFYFPDWRLVVANAVEMNIILPTLWGIIFGIIYSKVHRVIPSKGILKGFFFGLILFLITWIRISTFCISYGWLLLAAGHILSGSFKWITYGLVLGFLYDFLCKRFYSTKDESKIKTYDIRGGIFPGAIAGIADGLTAFAPNIIGPALGLFQIPRAPAFTLEMLVNQFGTHIFINMIWGAVFGAIFTGVYNLIPKKGVLKGVIYSLIIYFIANFLIISFLIGWGISSSAWPLFIDFILWTSIVGFFSTGIALGLVLGYLYKPPK